MSGVSENQYGNYQHTPLETTEFEQITNDLAGVKAEAKESIEKALMLLGSVIAGTSSRQSGAQDLEPPAASLLVNAADLAVRIGLIQDALNQLMQQVSKLEIDQKMSESIKANEDKLKQVEAQLKEAAEAIAKQNEADKKSGLFQAIGDWGSGCD